MDALRNLIGNIPDWSKRLDELSGQIAQRQIELAKFSDSESAASGVERTKSLRNKGSTESLKPKDDPEAHPGVASPPRQQSPTPLKGAMPSPAQITQDQPPQTPQTQTPQSPAPAQAQAQAQAPGTSPLPSPSHANGSPAAALHHQANQVMAIAQAKARATLRKRHRPESVVSAEGAPPKYRSRSMVIVYYDSYVQSFFEELVKFVSASRNLMRKAKMAAKVAQIKRMAELEMPDDEEDGDDSMPSQTIGGALLASSKLVADTPLEASKDKNDEEDLPPLKYISTRRMGPVSRTAGMLATGRPMYPRAGQRAQMQSSGSLAISRANANMDGKPDVYDELDKGLEYVQSMCEHAAHQFLRDGDCNEEIENIKRRLGETKESADKEMERVIKEEPETLNNQEPLKTRSFRPQSMRRDVMPDSPAAKEVNSKLEVDEAIDDMDEEPPKLVYKSTRMMR
ncbi:uncharacterized protein E0L32_007315 [Thyridium curvatum]|uniref:Uncharacterized protein n=1 Tax=Thyridium curvatum TaxID=1093900 RepID=A0A507APX5_9PEZI|nr:uncharacterized protein E0L32_007315 [Thyridium curvatum]TPX12012.1 hypothetical protein E0L32_007315 [Thyridium curvatum]